jgi:hypothetical protein
LPTLAVVQGCLIKRAGRYNNVPLYVTLSAASTAAPALPVAFRLVHLRVGTDPRAGQAGRSETRRRHHSTGRLAAITHAAVIKTIIVQVLRAPLEAVWDIDVAPGSFSEVHATPAGWRVVRVNCAA